MQKDNNLMDAVVCYAPNDYRLTKKDRPKANINEVILKIEACGICGSDCKAYSGASMFWEGEKPCLTAPVTPGHEFFGTVIELGEGAKEHFNINLGDKVIAEQIIPCNNCRFCKTGKYWMCETHHILGFQKDVAEGAMAEYLRIPKNAILHKIPDSVSLEDAALVEPMACAIHAINRADIQFDDTVVIAGAGPLGLCMVQAAKLKTPKNLIIIDMVDERLLLAKKLGANEAFNPNYDDVEKNIRDLTNQYGCDVYIEATGAPKAVNQGLSILRKLGRFIAFGVFGSETTTDWSIVGDQKELDIRGAHLGPFTYPTAINLFERGLVTSKGIVTHKYPLTDWENAFNVANSTNSVKVLLEP